ncbi:MAG: hypothetical protein GY851_01665, partial [bacterium]|nr:hypothetical protein [bacterium]
MRSPAAVTGVFLAGIVFLGQPGLLRADITFDPENRRIAVSGFPEESPATLLRIRETARDNGWSCVSYDAGTDTIFLAPLSDNPRNTEFALVRHMLHAFRDDAMLSYDSWEDG